ncbi:MAG: hypothetical protein N838_11660 [Thiohalocapsa sp. PB-PSB1]|nr:MAG: hypothetical protein N838_11660 [Thiohalocapsa sp. PB-PSB1]
MVKTPIRLQPSSAGDAWRSCLQFTLLLLTWRI